PGIGMIVAKTGAPVVPVRISGSFEAFPKNRSLPRRVPVTIVVGKPLEFCNPEYTNRDFYEKASDRVVDAVAALPST
ncbi:MAG: 1-acyl-sn-glycerol-3-phosphate acyltransferase, partial [Chthoniobacterales bacterium]